VNARGDRALVLLAASGLIGFAIAAGRFATWQAAVEASQVLGGVVEYPAGNPFYVYQRQLWTVLHQVLALLIRAGVPELVLSYAVSGLIGMISFQALSMLVFAFGGDLLLSLAVPALVLFTRAAGYGVAYPVALLGTAHTYGALGLSMLVLAIALFGSGCYRLGGLVAGVLPAVHPSLGAWLWLVGGIGALMDVRRLAPALRSAWLYAAAGAAVTAASLVTHIALTSDLARIDPAVSSRYLSVLVTAWDEHRAPVAIASVGVLMNVCVLLISAIGLTRFVEDAPPASTFAMRCLGISGALTLPLMFLSWLPPDRVPTAVLVLMPSRYLNVNVLAFAPLVLALLGSRGSLSGQLAAAGFACALAVTGRSAIFDVFPADEWPTPLFPLAPWTVFAAATLAAIVVGTTGRRARSGPIARLISRALPAGILAAAAIVAWRLPPASLFDRTNDALFAKVAAERDGQLLTSGTTQFVQLRSRRPVVLDGGALDMLAYSPASGPAMDDVLRRVYGIDFFSPPQELRGAAMIRDEFNQPVWEQYSLRTWQEIRRRFGVTQVLTGRAYTLDLPMAAEDSEFRLYRIPR
jgi:hypothetical protein